MRIQCLFNYQQWIGTWRSGFEQKTISTLLVHVSKRRKIIKILNTLTSLYHVERDTCTVHGRGTNTRYSGLILILRSKKDSHSIKHDRMQLVFKEHFQPIVFQKLKDWKTGEMLFERRYCSRRPPPKISLKHDHNWTKRNDQSGSTVEQHPVGKLILQSFRKAPRAEFSKPTQSNLWSIGETWGHRTSFDGERKNVPFTRDWW